MMILAVKVKVTEVMIMLFEHVSRMYLYRLLTWCVVCGAHDVLMKFHFHYMSECVFTAAVITVTESISFHRRVLLDQLLFLHNWCTLSINILFFMLFNLLVKLWDCPFAGQSNSVVYKRYDVHGHVDFYDEYLIISPHV